MPNNKDPQKGGSKSSMSGGSDREFESQGKNKSPETGGKQGQSTQHKGTGSDSNMENDEMTAGGRKGNFSDKNRGSEGQWSPGSSGASDQ